MVATVRNSLFYCLTKSNAFRIVPGKCGDSEQLIAKRIFLCHKLVYSLLEISLRYALEHITQAKRTSHRGIK